jgi:hypothetical protein
MAPRPKLAAPQAAVVASADQSINKNLKHKRRYCRSEGCSRIVKSQGLCQRHGAKPRTCKVDGCEKQAQGNFDRMCKSHFKALKRVETPLPVVNTLNAPPAPAGISIYDNVLPKSISFLPDTEEEEMPLIRHLKQGFEGGKPPAWHRNEERVARGMFPVSNPATQLEGWERELVWMEILVLTGAPNASFRHLARAWGRDKGFHMVLAQFICERQGDVERKKRLGERELQQKQQLARVLLQGQGLRPPITAAGKRPLKRRKKTVGPGGVISADVWDMAAYNDADYNEALAADIFNFSAQEFQSVSHRYQQKYATADSQSGSDNGTLANRIAVNRRPAGKKQEPTQEDSKPAPTVGAASTGMPAAMGMSAHVPVQHEHAAAPMSAHALAPQAAAPPQQAYYAAAPQLAPVADAPMLQHAPVNQKVQHAPILAHAHMEHHAPVHQQHVLEHHAPVHQQHVLEHQAPVHHAVEHQAPVHHATVPAHVPVHHVHHHHYHHHEDEHAIPDLPPPQEDHHHHPEQQSQYHEQHVNVQHEMHQPQMHHDVQHQQQQQVHHEVQHHHHEQQYHQQLHQIQHHEQHHTYSEQQQQQPVQHLDPQQQQMHPDQQQQQPVQHLDPQQQQMHPDQHNQQPVQHLDPQQQQMHLDQQQQQPVQHLDPQQQQMHPDQQQQQPVQHLDPQQQQMHPDQHNQQPYHKQDSA